jgi:hypothetical protein
MSLCTVGTRSRDLYFSPMALIGLSLLLRVSYRVLDQKMEKIIRFCTILEGHFRNIPLPSI